MGSGVELPKDGPHIAVDHVTGWTLTRRTQLDDLALLCHHDHYRKTYLGYTLHGPPGPRKLHPPPAKPPSAD